MALVASDEALGEAGWDGELPYDASRVGSIIGTGIGGIGTLTQNHQVLLEQGPGKVSPLAIPLMMGNAGSGAVAMRHKLKGPSFAPLSACAAGAHAIGEAVELIESGRADAVVAGGSEAGLVPLARAAFSALDALSPTGVSRPFDVRRDGFVMGEGAAVLILEDAEKARERGANVLAYVRGYGATTDAYHLTAPDKEGLGAAEAMRIALADAGLTPEDVVYVNAHGTSTPLGDSAETRVIKLALGEENARNTPVSSTKGATGHCLGAAGAVEAMFSVLAVQNGVLPPTINYEDPDPECDLDYIPNESREADVRVAVSNSFGFGGHNATIVLRRFED
jgi:3-oxoacyl-[acyl-carrier-protein] synthase II